VAECALNKWEASSFCKCESSPYRRSCCLNSSSSGICFQSNYSIIHLNNPDTPSQPCLSCTKQWCLNQNLPICAGASLGQTNPDTATGKEGDVEARCFRMIYISCLIVSLISGSERDSPRDQLVVTLFLLIVLGLLLGAGIKNRMEKAGLSMEIGQESGRRWWQVSDRDERGADKTNAALGMASAKTGEISRRIRRGWGSAAIDLLLAVLCVVSVTFRHMGSLCSKRGAHSGTHFAVPLEPQVQRQTLNPGNQRPPDPRAAAAAAAEQRLKAVSRATVIE
jgi:hypothetical protein